MGNAGRRPVVKTLRMMAGGSRPVGGRRARGGEVVVEVVGGGG